MMRWMYSAGVLIVAAILLGGCVQTDEHDRYPVERGGYEDRDRSHDQDRNRDRDGRDHDGWDRDGRDHDDRNGDGNRSPDDYRDRDGNRSPDGYRDRDNANEDGYHDRDGGDRNRDRDGERAIMSFVEQHQLPVKITNIEPLPPAPGMPAPAVTRYRVSVESTGPLKTKADRIVSYNPATGELSLER